jgi:Cof subfamily protein (haloacid dehalogenase superfamily)
MHAPTALVAIDLDGTLLRTDRTLSERSRAALAAVETAGIEVLLATARSPRSVRTIAADAGLGGTALCANGAIVYDLDRDRILMHSPLAAALAHRLVRGLRERVDGIVFGWEAGLRFGSEPAYEALRDPNWWPRPDDSFPPSDLLEWQEPITKLLARAPGADLEQILGIARELAGAEASATLAGQAFVELAAAGVTKAATLATLAAERGLEATRIVAFGDHLTDVEMLVWAGRGVAVANAHAAVLEAADEVTATNDEDGVALVLEQLLA